MKIKLMAIDFAGNVSEASMEIAGEKIIDQEIREYNLSQPEDGIIVNNADISGSSFLSSGNGLDLSEISFLGGSENGSGILPIMGVIVGGVALVGSFVAIKKKSL